MKYFKNYTDQDCDCGCIDCKNTQHYVLKESVEVSDNLQYHIDNNIVILENVFRYGSENYFNTINELRSIYESDQIELSDYNKFFINTDLGKKAVYEGEEVWLDFPYSDESINEAEYRGKKVELNKPKRGGSKAYYVYVKNDKGNVIKVSFGSGMRAKINDPEARRRYNQRHGCSKGRHNDKTKPGYWSCRLPRFSSALNLSGSGKWW